MLLVFDDEIVADLLVDGVVMCLQTVVLCGSCSTVLCTPTGGRARLTEGRSLMAAGFSIRQHHQRLAATRLLYLCLQRYSPAIIK